MIEFNLFLLKSAPKFVFELNKLNVSELSILALWFLFTKLLFDDLILVLTNDDKSTIELSFCSLTKLFSKS